MAIKTLFQKKPQLDKRIVELESTKEEIINEAVKNNRFCAYFFDALKTPLEKCKTLNHYEDYLFFYNIINTYDRRCKLSLEEGEMINNMMKDPNYYGAVHRTNLGRIDYINGIPTTPELYSIMEEGLINNGHGVSSGAFTETPGLSLTTTPLVGMAGIANFLFPYKENNAVILFKFSKENVKEDLSFKSDRDEEEIYIRRDGITYINPKYILGAFIKEEDSNKFYTREQLLSVKQNENKV